MKHICALKREDQKFTRLKWFHKFRVLSLENPMSLGTFRSEVSMRNEQQRHLKVNKYAIHPFSKFRAWYGLYLIYLYGSVLITKPIDAGFMRISNQIYITPYRIYTIFMDVLCWIDIVINFFNGFEVDGNKIIELRPWKIARRYLMSYFIIDVLSSIPKCTLVYLPRTRPKSRIIVGIVSILCLLKFVRIVSVVKCIKRSAEYFRFTSKSVLFLLSSTIVFLVIVHWLSCLQFAVPKMVRRSLASEVSQGSWFFDESDQTDIYDKNTIAQYTHCFFKTTAYILGIRIDLYKMALPEEYILAIFTYFIGKIMLAYMWIVLAVAILNTRIMNVKFLEIMNQLEAYMQQKKFPLNLRDRVLQYFIYKYRNNFLKEDLITSLLSENIRREVNLHVCKSLIRNVSLFCELTPMEISKIVDYLIPEIFLPNDFIIRAGCPGKVMYFLSSGTVAVYTRSGREICHLQDGAYFGEIALVLKGHLRLTSVVALETCHVYRLHKKDLERCLLINKSIREKVLEEAEQRLKETVRLEESYRERLFEKSFRQAQYK